MLNYLQLPSDLVTQLSSPHIPIIILSHPHISAFLLRSSHPTTLLPQNPSTHKTLTHPPEHAPSSLHLPPSSIPPSYLRITTYTDILIIFTQCTHPSTHPTHHLHVPHAHLLHPCPALGSYLTTYIRYVPHSGKRRYSTLCTSVCALHSSDGHADTRALGRKGTGCQVGSCRWQSEK